MKIALGNDHAGLSLKSCVIEFLKSKQIEIVDYGTNNLNQCYSPPIAEKVARSVLEGESDKGILICGTGVGMSLAANKIKGIRCAVCSEPYTAKMSRAHNNTNVLALGGRVLGHELAKMIVDIWIDTEFEGGRKQHSYDLITEIENREFK